MAERRQFLTVPLPVCDLCGETVRAHLCGTRAMSLQDVEAIQSILLAAHKMLAHNVRDDADDVDEAERFRRIQARIRAQDEAARAAVAQWMQETGRG